MDRRMNDGFWHAVGIGHISLVHYYAHHAGAISMSVIRAEGERLQKGMQKIEAKLYRPRMRRADEAAAAGGASEVVDADAKRAVSGVNYRRT